MFEAKQTQYRLSLIDVMDNKGLPLNITVLVNNEDVKVFEEFINNSKDNLFIHADGGNIEF